LLCLIFNSTITNFCERNTLTDGSVSISHALEALLDQAGFDGIRVEALESCCSSTAEHGQVKIPMFIASGRRR
jgi:hypothetical protein